MNGEQQKVRGPPKIAVLGLFQRQFELLQRRAGKDCVLVHYDKRHLNKARNVDAVVLCTAFISHGMQEWVMKKLGDECLIRRANGGVTSCVRVVKELAKEIVKQ